MARQRTRRKGSSLRQADPVTAYARGVVRGRIVAGPHVRAQCQRHLDDLEGAAARGLVWDFPAAARAIEFFPTCLRLSEGEFAGRPFVLQGWQKFIIGSLFGWKTSDGTRRFRTAYIEVGKGNGKSPLAAGVCLYMLTADGEESAEVYSAATVKDQAKILFRDGENMVEQSPALSRRLVRTLNNIAYVKTSSFFKPLSSEKRGLDGKRVHCAAIDELHEHPDSTVVDKMRAGTKGRRQALIFMITNAGVDRQSVCWRYHRYAERIYAGEIANDTFFAYVCALDKDDDWQDELAWIKANPNLDVSISRKYLREQVAEAQGMPDKESIVRRLNLCQWVDAANPWISRERWDACVGEFDVSALGIARCCGGLDLSGKNDLTALALAFELPDGRIGTRVYFWTPEDSIKERERRDQSPYSLWVDQGHLIATPGMSIDYAFVAAQIADLRGRHALRSIAFDRYRIDDLERELADAGVPCVVIRTEKDEEGLDESTLRLIPHGQGFADMGPAVDALETAVLNQQLRVWPNPVMNMCAANAVVTQDAAANRKFDKRPSKSFGRIDGLVAAAMAVRKLLSADAAAPRQSAYETQDLQVV